MATTALDSERPACEAAAPRLAVAMGRQDARGTRDLQRAAGNAAVARLARSGVLHNVPPSGTRSLARCGVGGCTCGGGCTRRAEDDELMRAGQQALRRAVLARAAATGPEPTLATSRRSARARTLQRNVTVTNPAANIPNPAGTTPQTNAATVMTYLNTLCPTGTVTVDASSGAVGLSAAFCPSPTPAGFIGPPAPAPAQTSSTPAGCGCLCDMVASPHDWTITIDDATWPHTTFGDAAKAAQPGVGTGGDVTAPSPNSPQFWGAGTATGGTLDTDPWLVLGHELCGHAWMGDHGAHGPDQTQPRGQGGHQETVRRENLIRAEHGITARGGFKDPNCGESYSRDRANPGTVHWSSFRNTCITWRTNYNAAHGTNYCITDTIP